MSQSCSVADLIEASYALGRSGDNGAAFQRAQEALEQARAGGEKGTSAAALLCLATACFRLGHYLDAQSLGEEAQDLAAADSPESIEALLMLGMCATETSDLAAGEDFYRRALDLSRQLGDYRYLQRALVDLAAGVYIPRGQFDLALAADEEALRIARERLVPEAVQLPLIGIAWASITTGQLLRARAALDTLSRVAPPGSTAQGHYYSLSADLRREEGDIVAALELYARARGIAETTGDPGLTIWLRLGTSRCERLNGNASAAFEWANDALTIASRLGYCHFQGLAFIERGRATWHSGDAIAAEADLHAAIEILNRLGAAFDLARARLFLAALLHSRKREEACAAFSEAARSILAGGYAFLLEQEQALALPLVAANLYNPDPVLSSACTVLLEQLERVPPPHLTVRTLGGLRVVQGSRQLEERGFHQRRAGELFSLLLLSPTHSLSFEQIAEALWPDKEPRGAQIAFHHATATLRRVLDPDLPDKFPSRYLKVEEGRVTLHLPACSSVDFEILEARCREKDWDAAVALRGGELLPEYPYADWAVAPRQRLAQLYLRALLGLAENKFAGGLDDEALDLCCRVLALEPWQEQAVLLGMQACLRMNNLARARRLYRELEKSLRDDLAAEPQEELRALYRSLTPNARVKPRTCVF